uniref:cyclin-dependent kinase 2-interacting protein n=1 Tax=Myxine glutinosa TaxID=7769 RepID=UPI00358FA290
MAGRAVSEPSARKIKDSVADLYNLTSRWQRLSREGFTIASRIAKKCISTSIDANASIEVTTDRSVEEERKEGSRYNLEMEEWCQDLTEIVKKLEHVVKKMERIVTTLLSICELEWHQNGRKWRKCPVFLTWHTLRFYLVARNVLGTYEREMALRRLIASDLAHVSSRAAAMVLLSSWLYEPHISPHTAFDLQSMLLETGYQLPTQRQ